ncbi:methylmalonyl Co-A mutase-associated GTPase MeaB [Arsenicicoccus dermatophilus]|uniref:methylmalonyl Co-A mutase-associated GTPase MeaB n=1 Tax=Arsenicicoccus dermatophilus TaxID=1076331 RepID=UPI003916FC34
MREALSVDRLVAGVRHRDRAVVARALTLVESSRPEHRELARELLRELAPDAGYARRVGISGVPGVGKSTFTDALGTRLVDRGHRVGVLAVDPSSSRTGGSILGDRTRMAALAARDDAYIRPAPSGGHLGGVARATRDSIVVLEAAGFDVVVVETVGVGQSEVAVSGMVDTFLFLALARSGDQLQGIKRGILELADVIAVNKADGEHAGEARVTARELAVAMRLVLGPDEGRPQVLTCSALTGDGLDEVWQAVVDHADGLRRRGVLEERRRRQQVDWLRAVVQDELRLMLSGSGHAGAVARAAEQDVASGAVTVPEAMDRVLIALAADLTARAPGRAPESARGPAPESAGGHAPG